MLTLYSYPPLFGVADNNAFGLKVFAFLKLTGLPFQHQVVFDASKAPRGQLPYIVDGERTIGDSDTIISYLTQRYGLAIDESLTASQRDMGFLVRRTLDDLYWVMTYSRWKDPRFWPAFKQAFLDQHPEIGGEALEAARDYNAKRQHYQGIGRYEPDDAYARGIADLTALGHLLPKSGFLFGPRPSSADASIYGFTANIYFYDIDTPLKAYLLSHAHIAGHCRLVHQAVTGPAGSSSS
jgi:glutathione S-transferase